MNIDISNKVVVISGAANGIGKVLAERFAQEGTKLSLLDIDYAGLKDTANSISEKNFHTPLIIKCDVSSEDQVKIDNCNSQILQFVNDKKIKVVDR